MQKANQDCAGAVLQVNSLLTAVYARGGLREQLKYRTNMVHFGFGCKLKWCQGGLWLDYAEVLLC
jgi:hypothetical protein